MYRVFIVFVNEEIMVLFMKFQSVIYFTSMQKHLSDDAI